jgi:hypothetical protein
VYQNCAHSEAQADKEADGPEVANQISILHGFAPEIAALKKELHHRTHFTELTTQRFL